MSVSKWGQSVYHILTNSPGWEDHRNCYLLKSNKLVLGDGNFVNIGYDDRVSNVVSSDPWGSMYRCCLDPWSHPGRSVDPQTYRPQPCTVFVLLGLENRGRGIKQPIIGGQNVSIRPKGYYYFSMIVNFFLNINRALWTFLTGRMSPAAETSIKASATNVHLKTITIISDFNR